MTSAVPAATVRLGAALLELAERANAAHAACARAVREGLAHAIDAGLALMEAKAALPHGQWLPWLAANVHFAERTAQAYMRVAREQPRLLSENPQALADLGFEDALKLLASPRDPEPTRLQQLEATIEHGRTTFDEVRTAAGELRAAGVEWEGMEIINALEKRIFASEDAAAHARHELRQRGVEPHLRVAGYPVHPVAQLSPPMTDAEFEALVASIREIGQIMPITLFRGMVIDGKERARACERLGIAPITREFDGDESGLVSYVISMNMLRTHYTEDQRAIVAARVSESAS